GAEEVMTGHGGRSEKRVVRMSERPQAEVSVERVDGGGEVVVWGTNELNRLKLGYSREESFFFSSRRRHTRSKRDWSSDVCSSDLQACCRNRTSGPLLCKEGRCDARAHVYEAGSVTRCRRSAASLL